MANEIEIKIPDIGGATQVDVIEILVHVGEEISIDTPLITLETDKASMEIPSPKAGKITKISVKVGDKVSEGDSILLIQSSDEASKEVKEPASSNKIEKSAVESASETPKPVTKNSQPQSLEVLIPDIGGATDVDVIDILVKPGMQIEKDDALITLEGDKATMDIPSPYSGTVKAVKIKLGDKVSQGSAILTIETNEELDKLSSPASKEISPSQEEHSPSVSEQPKAEFKAEPMLEDTTSNSGVIAAGPAVRRLARELGVNLALVKGSGRKNRIIKEDLQAYVKERLSERPASGGFNLPGNPVIDFSKFGDIETKPLNKIKKLTGINVHRSWITIPHVTQFDEADITDLEAFRKLESDHAKNAGYKLTILAFVCGVVSKALQVYPQFNASLDATGENLIYKKYCNLGIAVETPNGLVVPVIKNVDKLSISEIATEMARLSSKARDKGLMPADMSGGCFTISSLGGIGGTAFTPIVNSPEVAILGLSRSTIKPVYDNGEFKPRLMLPLSLSYDHRVIDGAEAARFTRFICDALSDIRKILL
ncbi:dihydrolipoyllysine-residue acetyltransferase [Legionella maioricensis]|uniref:Acetyltransferase component of pyruvate dehydrogenase complex n=1 Tax=Legionella maioricensis TaxID=2896528 RepID=A0A9X2ICP7_9GAMM|nr:dihydrolipoyllysine-residue acetyltransferase [Legionella maioricensis]MCL9685655.1 dihydrolipoyllysine-residue acetyltransferase [Legionella maioricensis]MCL9689079.1 dihydrolipoyllysine-residue acetyltransferase [Legionella maioricensis]